MSGNMRGNEYRRQNMSHWNSNLNVDSCSQDDDACSQYSDDFGSDGTRAPDIGQRLRNLFKNQLYTDVKFVVSCGVKPKPVLEAHRAILAAGSVKFADMLYGQASRDIVKEVHPEIQINNIPFDAFKSVVEFLYTDDVFFCSDPAVIDILNAAKTFQVQPLVTRCESYFESSEITESTACTKLQLGTAHKMEPLKNRCLQFIQENTRAVIRSDDFKSAALSTVRTICKLPKFNLRSEKELFDAVLEWVDAQPEGQLKRKEVLEPLLKHIRFLTIPLAEFTTLVDQCHGQDILSARDALNIVVYLSNPSKNVPSNIPAWCNKGPNRCALVNAQARPSVPRGQIGDQTVAISLKQIKRGYMNSLICILKMKCLRGNYQVRGLKLAFGDPVTEHSCIGHLVIKVNVQPSGFNFVEHCKIENSKEVPITFSRTPLVRGGDTLEFHAEVSEARGYNFLQFDQENSFAEESPFECSLGSVPKENRLFFIKEVMYIATQPRMKNIRNFRGGKRA